MVQHNAYLHTRVSKPAFQMGEAISLEYTCIPLFAGASVNEIGVTVFRDSVMVHRQKLPPELPGHGIIKIPPDKSGPHTLEISIVDKKGRRIVNREYCYVYERLGEEWPSDSLTVSSDKPSYERSDTAVFTVTSGDEDARVLCSVEDRRIVSCKVKRLSKGQAAFRIPVKDLTPSARILFSYAGREALREMPFPLRIRDTIHSAQVGIEGKQVLKPGEWFAGKVKVTDNRGRPLQARFFPALRSEGGDPRESPRSPAPEVPLSLEKSLNILSFGQRHGVATYPPGFFPSDRLLLEREPRIDWPDGELLGGEQALFSAEQRWGRASDDEVKEMLTAGDEQIFSRNFLPIRDANTLGPIRDGELWSPPITTDAQGEAFVNIRMPNSRGKWNLVLAGSSPGGMFQYVNDITVEQDLLVELEAPDRGVKGDEILVTSKISNYSSQNIRAQVVLSPGIHNRELNILGDSVRFLGLHPEDSTFQTWSISLSQAGTYTLVLRAFAKDNAHQDSVTIVVKEYGEPESIIRSGLMKGDGTKPKLYYKLDLNLPEEVDYPSRQLLFECFPTALHVIMEAMTYLKPGHDPNLEGVVNGFLPQLEFLAILDNGALKDSLAIPIHSNTVLGVASLGRRQNADGGWGWWPSDASDPGMTSLALQGLSVARTALKEAWGIEEKRILQKGVASALLQIRNSKLDLSVRTYLAYGICHTQEYRNIEEPVREIFHARKTLSSYVLALLLECLRTLDWKTEAGEVLTLLEERSLEITSEVSWSGDYRYAWFNQSSEATGQVLKVLGDWYPKHRLANKSIPFLMRTGKDIFKPQKAKPVYCRGTGAGKQSVQGSSGTSR
jgi:hypothetical protein